jgi:hypothetical protein
LFGCEVVHSRLGRRDRRGRLAVARAICYRREMDDLRHDEEKWEDAEFQIREIIDGLCNEKTSEERAAITKRAVDVVMEAADCKPRYPKTFEERISEYGYVRALWEEFWPALRAWILLAIAVLVLFWGYRWLMFG